MIFLWNIGLLWILRTVKYSLLHERTDDFACVEKYKKGTYDVQLYDNSMGLDEYKT